MVTVVDAANLLKDYSLAAISCAIAARSLGEDDERTLVDLLVEQIEFADVIVLNKVDVATPRERDAARTIIRALNADARIIETDARRRCRSTTSSTPACSTSRRRAAASALVQGAARLQGSCAGDRGIRHLELRLSRARGRSTRRSCTPSSDKPGRA